MRPLTPRPPRLVPAEQLLDPTNRLLAKAGIKNVAELHALIEAAIADIPEVRRLSAVCERHDAVGVLSGGTASMLIAAAIENAASGKAKVRSLNDMGSDIDALVMSRRQDELRPGLGNKIASELNDSNSFVINPTVPSSLRRRMVLEWDVNEVDAFARAIETYGGDPLSQIGIGLSGGKLYIFDPHNGIADFFHGRLRWMPPRGNPYDSPLFEGLQYDPALEGLRLIRMIGRFKSAGVEPTAETKDQLREFGDSALRKRLVSKALVAAPDDNGDFKLRRRWEKYVTRIWADSADLGESLALVNENHYTELLQQMGMGTLVLQPLANRLHTAFLEGSTPEGVIRGGELSAPYVWLSSRMLEQFMEGKVYGSRSNDGAFGLTCQSSLFEGKGYGSMLTKVHLVPESGYLDLRSDAGKAIVADVCSRLHLEDQPEAVKLDRVLEEMGLAGVLTGGSPPEVTVANSTAIARFESARLNVSDVLDELPRTEPGQMGLAIRVAFALGRQDAAEDLGRRIADGRIPATKLLHPSTVDALLEAPVRSGKLQAAFDGIDRERLPVAERVELLRLTSGWAAIRAAGGTILEGSK